MGEDRPKRQGVFMPAGARFVIPAGSIIASVGDDGELKMTMTTIHFSRDMTPTWLQIAVDLLGVTSEAHERVVAILDSGDDEGLGEALERESAAGMQAVIAAATAVDALYASVKERLVLPPSLVGRWRERGTARWRQVVEVLRRGFRVPDGAPLQNLRNAMRELYRYRGMAVHPSGKSAEVMYHPDLGQGTDWRFVTFGHASVLQFVWIAVGFTHALLVATSGERDSEAMAAFRGELTAQLQPLFDSWAAEYGDISHNPAAAESA